MQNQHKIMLAVVAGLLAGFYLANAPSTTGIYANKVIGQTAANLYVAGAKLGGGKAPAVPAATAT